MSNLEFGNKYKDIVLGIEGILVELVKFSTGCDRVKLVFNQNNEEKDHWTDDTLIELVEETLTKEQKSRLNKLEDIEEALFNFGDHLRDKATGREGYVIGIDLKITGDISYGLSKEYNASHKENQTNWYDEGRLEVVSSKKVNVTKGSKRTGGVAGPNFASH